VTSSPCLTQCSLLGSQRTVAVSVRMSPLGRTVAFQSLGNSLVAERRMTVSKGRKAGLEGSPREGPESAPKPPFHCEREIGFPLSGLRVVFDRILNRGGAFIGLVTESADFK
jgi:hypothetical protein